jgi:hypothetical protein
MYRSKKRRAPAATIYSISSAKSVAVETQSPFSLEADHELELRPGPNGLR